MLDCLIVLYKAKLLPESMVEVHVCVCVCVVCVCVCIHVLVAHLVLVPTPFPRLRTSFIQVGGGHCSKRRFLLCTLTPPSSPLSSGGPLIPRPPPLAPSHPARLKDERPSLT